MSSDATPPATSESQDHQDQPGGRLALFPGTFDPITFGHLDVIRRSRTLFDRLVLGIGQHPGKHPLFSPAQRREMIEELLRREGLSNVEVRVYAGLTVDFAKQLGAVALLRGLRNVTDLNYEFQLALTNRAVADIETVFIMTGDEYAFASSSLIKQIAAAGALDRLHRLVPEPILKRLQHKMQQNGDKGIDGIPRQDALHQE
jgi:pantetheine-phosphate adenylyltransferase